MSMQTNEIEQLHVPEEPPAEADPATFTSVQLRMPDGSKLQRRFLKTDTIGAMMNFVKKSKPGLSTVRFITTFPKKVFEDENMTLADAKFGKSEALNVDAK